jgi:adenosylcobinamide amidohydrolase
MQLLVEITIPAGTEPFASRGRKEAGEVIAVVIDREINKAAMLPLLVSLFFKRHSGPSY